MQNGMKALPCGKLMMCANKVVVTYVRYSGSVKATRLAELAKAHSSRRLVCNLTKILRWGIYGTSGHSEPDASEEDLSYNQFLWWRGWSGIGSRITAKTPNACIPGRETVEPEIPHSNLAKDRKLTPLHGTSGLPPYHIGFRGHLDAINPRFGNTIRPARGVHRFMCFDAVPAIVNKRYAGCQVGRSTRTRHILLALNEALTRATPHPPPMPAPEAVNYQGLTLQHFGKGSERGLESTGSGWVWSCPTHAEIDPFPHIIRERKRPRR